MLRRDFELNHVPTSNQKFTSPRGRARPALFFHQDPQQLVVVILLAFLVPITGIVLLVQLVVSVPRRSQRAVPGIRERTYPARGRLEFGAPAAAPGSRPGEAIVKAVCATCHQAGVANAPKLGDPKDWAPRINARPKSMIATSIKGKGACRRAAAMPR